MIKTKKTKSRLWLVLTVLVTIAISAMALAITLTPRQEQQPLTSESVLVLGVWDQVETGSSVEPEVVIYDGDYQLRRNIDYTLAYSNNTEPGEATITVTGIGKYSGTQTMKFRILSNEEIPTFFSIEDLDIVAIPAQTYTGAEITPGVVIMDGEEPLDTENYLVNYYANIKAGLAQAVVYGTGDYTGMRIVSFEIAPKDIDDTTVAAVAAQTYSGYSLTPAVTITDGERTLAAADYTVAYSNNINAGNASVVITGSGNYTGTQTVPFVIAPKELDQDMLVDFEPVVYTTEGHYFDDAILWNNERRLVAGVDYEFDDTAWYLDAGNYIVVIPGTGNYTGEISATISITPKTIGFAEVVIEPQVYTGSAIEPEVEGWDDETELVSGTDFTLDFENNIDVGTATLYISGAGNYTGSITVPFSIVQRNIEPAYIAPIDAQTYTGSAIEPALTVTLAGRTLTAADYTVSYSNNTNLGLATVTLTGQGNYTGTVSTVFEIVEEEDEDPEYTLLPFTFDGETLTGYTGTATEIVIPASYSKGETRTEEIANELFDFSAADEWERDWLFESALYSLAEQLMSNGHNFDTYELIDGVLYGGNSTGQLNGGITYFFEETSTGIYSLRLIKETTDFFVGDDYIVEFIGENAFTGCTSLTSITIPEGVTSIGNSAFTGCTSLTSITIPEGVTSIGNSAFTGCTSLTSITIPEGVTSIGNSAFTGCTSLTSITIPEGVTSIGNSAFSNCTSLTSITIPESVTSIGNSAFTGCTSLTSITIPESVTSIGNSAFSNCTSLTSITIPESVTAIEQNTFWGCTSLTSITIPEGVTSIEEYTFVACTSLTSITIPEGVTSIKQYTFWGCTSLTSITIPESVTSIEQNTFANCTGLTLITWLGDITIEPESVAFYVQDSSPQHLDIYLPNVTTVLALEAWSISSLTADYVTYHVPSSLLSSYQATYPDNIFQAII